MSNEELKLYRCPSDEDTSDQPVMLSTPMISESPNTLCEPVLIWKSSEVSPNEVDPVDVDDIIVWDWNTLAVILPSTTISPWW